jgi:2-oxoisovalerate dehydrogenase E1 component
VQAGLDAARARPNPDPASVARWVYADDAPGSPEAVGGLSRAERATLDGTTQPAEGRGHCSLRRSHSAYTAPTSSRSTRKVLVFGEDVGRKGGVHLVTEGLQKQFGDRRVFDTSLSEEGIIGRSVGMAIAGLMPVAEIQFRKYADPAAEQLNNCGTLRWRPPIGSRRPSSFACPGGSARTSATRGTA